MELKAESLEKVRDHGLLLDDPAELSRGLSAYLASRLYVEFRTDDGASNLSLEGLVLELLAEASRRRPAGSDRGSPPWLSGIEDRLRATMDGRPSLAELAAEAGVHPVHLARTFRRRHGCTVGEYLRRLRVEAARRRLASSGEPLAEIALSLGFADQSHFTRTFKRHTGVTPSLYRRTCRER